MMDAKAAKKALMEAGLKAPEATLKMTTADNGNGEYSESVINYIIKDYQKTSDVQEESSVTDDIREEALQQIREGTCFQYILESCMKHHVCASKSERHVLEALVYSCASTRVYNCEGIDIGIVGTPGAGKSHAAETAGNHFDRVLDGFMSSKVHSRLGACGLLKPGTVIYQDDQKLDEAASGIYKASHSGNWNKEYKSHTIKGNNHEIEEGVIPPRCPRWLVYATGMDDNQITSREIYLHADDSIEQKLMIREKQNADDENPFLATDTRSMEVSKQIWRELGDEPFIVMIPFARRIECDEGEGNRTYNMMRTLVKCSAVLAKGKRETVESADGRTAIVANEDDFKAAATLMNDLIMGVGGSQKHKLTPAGERILNYFIEHYAENGDSSGAFFTFKEVEDALIISESDLSRAKSKLTEIPGIRVDRDPENIHPNAKRFEFSYDTYMSWSGSLGYYTLKDE